MKNSEYWIEIDYYFLDKAQELLKKKKVKYTLGGNVFFFTSADVKKTAFKIFNNNRIIIY